MIRSASRSKRAINALLTAAAWVAGSAHALQILEGSEGTTLFAKVSKKEITRLSIEQGRVVTLRVKEGELNIDPDDETGQLFVTVPPGVDKPINGFLTTDAGRTYTMVLQPTDVPSDSIVIKQPRPKTRPVPSEFKNTSYDKSVKRMITAMANDDLPDDIEVKEVGQSLSLWKEASMTLERQYNADRMVGERYRVANISSEPMVLDEREFYRKGVSVVAIEQLNLVPGGSTRVFVIREKALHE